MLLSAALPQHGPTPNPQQKKKMEEAGPLIYDAYNLFQSGSQNVEAAYEEANQNTTNARERSRNTSKLRTKHVPTLHG